MVVSDVKRLTELKYFFLQMEPTIIDFMPRYSGPMPYTAADCGSWCVHAGGIEEFGKKIQLPGGAGYVKRPITSGMLGNVEASKIQAGVDTEKIRDAKKYRDADEANKARSMPRIVRRMTALSGWTRG